MFGSGKNTGLYTRVYCNLCTVSQQRLRVFRCVAYAAHFFNLGEKYMDLKPLPVEFIKKIDGVGRLVIPEELRKVLNITGPTEVVLTYTDQGILINIKNRK